MRFFTIAWHSGEMPDDEAAAIPDAYESHIRALVPSLPPDALRLVRAISLHDGLIRQASFTASAIDILIRAGDLQVGYFDARLHYVGGAISQADSQFLEGATDDSNTEILYDEFDSAESGWIHRILFWPYREVLIQFAALELAVMPKSDRFDTGAA